MMAADSQQDSNVITSSIWQEDVHPDNPFLAQEFFLRGIPLLADNGILKHASAFDAFFFAYTGRKPQVWETSLLEKMTVTAMTIGPRAYPARAALAAGAGNSTIASMLIASAAAGAGQLGGGHELVTLLEYWEHFGTNLEAWQTQLKHSISTDNNTDDNVIESILSVWPAIDHPPGYDPNITQPIPAVVTSLELLSGLSQGSALPWLMKHREVLEHSVEMPLSLVAVIAAGFHDLRFTPPAAEFFWLWMLVMASGLHGIEQIMHGADKYPLFPHGIKLTP